ncbi:MAG: flagellar type III secretion system pore protein FliP [Alphaproteobacteria bacterium]
MTGRILHPAIRRNLLLALAAAATALLALVTLGHAPALAQSINVDLGDGGSSTGRIVQVIAILTVLSLAPSLLVMVTCFARIVIVLSLLRTAMGAQATPPNSVLISLALFLTFFVMQPTLERSYNEGIQPLIEDRITEEQAFERAVAPIHAFMMRHVRAKDLELFLGIAKIPPVTEPAATPLRALVPAFMISELRRAFEIGFLLFIPFLIIDMVIASVLMSMGMMMLPPVMISLPFKLIFFVLVDGWYLVAGSLIQSFVAG